MNPDAVNHWDLPVTEFRPRRAVARVLCVTERGDPADPAVEARLLLRREDVSVFDFYRGRANRAEAIKRYG
jgi:hypothetical protein